MAAIQTCPICNGTGKAVIELNDLPFWYPINVVLTALQANVLATVTVDNDNDFEWRWIIASSILTGGGAGLFSVTLFDMYTNRPLSPSNINGENLAGTAQLPFILPKPYLIRRTSSIRGTFTERSNNGNTIQLCLVGYKLAG